MTTPSICRTPARPPPTGRDWKRAGPGARQSRQLGPHLGATDDNAAEIAAVADSIAQKVYLGSSTGDPLVTSGGARWSVSSGSRRGQGSGEPPRRGRSDRPPPPGAAASGGAPRPPTWGSRIGRLPRPQSWGSSVGPDPKNGEPLEPRFRGWGPNPEPPGFGGVWAACGLGARLGAPAGGSSSGGAARPGAGERTGATLYFCHASTAAELALLREAKAKGQPVYVEAAPHHLLLSEEDLAALGNFGKVNSTLRPPPTVRRLGRDRRRHGGHPRHRPCTAPPRGEGTAAPAGAFRHARPGSGAAADADRASQGRLSFQRLVELLTSARAAALRIRPRTGCWSTWRRTDAASRPARQSAPDPQEWGSRISRPPVSGGWGAKPQSPPVSGGWGPLILSRCG